MLNILSRFFENPIVKTISSWVAAIANPIRRGWNWLVSPILRLFSPLTAPILRRWEVFAAQNPRSGFVIGWLATFVKWGFQFLLFLVFGVWIGLFGHLPSGSELREIETAQTTEVYSADSVLIGKYFIENRTTIKLKDISPHVVKALIATEDKRFFEHSGIDFMSWARVLKGFAKKENLGGGSTLSQQLAKNLYPRRDYRIPGISLLINKIRENFISIRLERIYEKEELLNLYLNTVPFGADRFGISVASKFFFNKKAKELTPDQAATLVGMLKASTRYDPVRNPDESKKRRNVVMQQMLKNGDLTQKEYEELAKKPVGAKRNSREGSNDGAATYFREYLRTDVLPKMLKNYKKEDGTDYNLYTDGLKIYTTLHSKMQEYAEEAVQKHMQTLQKQFNDHWKNYKKDKPWGDDKWIDEQIKKSERWQAYKDAGLSAEEALRRFEQDSFRMTVFSWKDGGTEQEVRMTPLDSVRYYFTMLNCGFMTMDHRNGYVRAWVGGINFKYFKYDHIKSTRQVGSTFKPIVYATALVDSILPCNYFDNHIKKIEDWEPHNADERYGGWYSVAGALKNSVNVVAAQLIEKVGIQKTLDMARKMGVTSTLPREFGISLGAADVSLYEMMQVYATIANKGIRPDPVVVTRIATREGTVLYDIKEEQKTHPVVKRDTALNEWQAALLRKMMQGVLDSGGTGARFRRAHGIQGDFAGKTGTTQNQSDGWFIVFNPQLVTGAWVGGASPAVRFRAMYLGQGSASALPISAWFWYKMAQDKKLSKLLWEKFTDPKNMDISQYFGCASRVWVHPDSLYLLDSLATDSMGMNIFEKLKENAAKLFGKDKQDDGQSSEGGDEPDGEKAIRPNTKEQKKEERKEKRKEFFDKLLGKKDQ